MTNTFISVSVNLHCPICGEQIYLKSNSKDHDAWSPSQIISIPLKFRNIDVYNIDNVSPDVERLSIRAVNSLWREGITKLGALNGKSFLEIMKIKDFGNKALNELRSLVKNLNNLDDENPPNAV